MIAPERAGDAYETFCGMYEDSRIKRIYLSPMTCKAEWSDMQKQTLVGEYEKIFEIYADCIRSKKPPKARFELVENGFYISRLRRDFTPIEKQRYEITMHGGEFCIDSDGLFKLHGMGALLDIPDIIGDSVTGIDKYKVIAALKKQIVIRRESIEKTCDGSCAMCANIGMPFCLNTLRAPFSFAYIWDAHCFAAKLTFAFFVSIARLLEDTNRSVDFVKIYNEVSNYAPKNKKGEQILKELIGTKNISELETKWNKFSSPYLFEIINEKGW
jgi:hypothetical protein